MHPSNPSIALTDGVRVDVVSRYLPQQSNPTTHRYAWAYTVTITNEGGSTAALDTRHWIITDAVGKVEEVRGPGVVGEHPRLTTGESFRYTSGCILETPRGTMHGSYQMVRDDGQRFNAEIAPFTLSMPHALN